MAGNPFAMDKAVDKESKAEDQPGDEQEPMHKSKFKGKKLTKKQAQQIAKRRLELKRKMAASKKHK